MTPQARQAGDMRREILASKTLQTSMGLSDAQVKALQATPWPVGAGLVLLPADKEKLKTLWAAYTAAGEGAAKTSAQAALVAEFKTIGDSSLAATRVQFDTLATKLKALLTPEQLQKYQSRGKP